MKPLRVLHLFVLGITALIATGCDTDRISKLEKENQEMKAKLEKSNAAQEFDLQAKCGKDARVWFNLNFTPREKNTVYQDYSNHYNKKLNACFIFVEYHFNTPPTSNWHSTISLWNVYENNQYGKFDEGHYYDIKPGDQPRVNDCLVVGTKCNSEDEFNKLLLKLEEVLK